MVLVSSSASAVERFSSMHESCIRRAAATYYQPSDPVSYAGLVDLIHALMGVEGGCGRTHVNDNHSVDYGCMQINSSTLNRLARRGYGFDTSVVQFNDCQNIMLGTWVIESELKTGSDVWTSIGNYNSHTLKHNRDYQLKVWHQLQLLWSNRLAGR
jgi:soluble lytic murein transglycosylase-like protein